MKRHHVLYKKRGETPLEALSIWKRQHPLYQDVRASYAGRLDPMASGKLLVLLGEECKNQKQYIGLDKEYEIEILLDIGTDTGDILGLPSLSGVSTHPSVPQLEEVFRKEKGSHERTYPTYSSKTVKGVPLFLYALKGTLDTISIPTHTETVYKTKILDVTKLSLGEVSGRIEKGLEVVPRDPAESKKEGADFRQDEVRAQWKTLLSSLPSREFTVIRVRVTAGTGTYMRSLAERVGEALGTKALALSIHRTRIGKYVPFLSGFWIKDYR